MNLRKLLLTENACYKAGKTITVKGIMLHSTGANNPNLKRYVGPDDGFLGVNQYGNHWNTAYPDNGRQVCPHAFIGKLADGSVATYQTLPWKWRGWHGASGPKGSANDTHIGFEICEDGLTDATYFEKVYQEAVEICAYLCKEFNLDPMADGVIICHSEGHARGIASNHGDVMHWFPKFDRNMDTFREAVRMALNASGGSTGHLTPATPENAATGEIYGVGDVVNFAGGPHYRSANAIAAAGTPATGPAEVTATSAGAVHPYHLVHADSSSTVYGWVDAARITGKVTENGPTVPYLVRVTGSPVNIRKGPGSNYGTNGSIQDKGIYTIVEEANGTGAKKWGRLKSGAGWISLDYTTKI